MKFTLLQCHANTSCENGNTQIVVLKFIVVQFNYYSHFKQFSLGNCEMRLL